LWILALSRWKIHFFAEILLAKGKRCICNMSWYFLAFIWPSINAIWVFPLYRNPAQTMTLPPPDRCLLKYCGSFLKSCQYYWNPSGPFKFNFFSSLKTTDDRSVDQDLCFRAHSSLAILWRSLIAGWTNFFRYWNLPEALSVRAIVHFNVFSPNWLAI
jgi:hypothetical protein